MSASIRRHLEDGLSDLGVISKRLETIGAFPDDDPLEAELRSLIDDARARLRRRLEEVRLGIALAEPAQQFLAPALRELLAALADEQEVRELEIFEASIRRRYEALIQWAPDA